MRALTLSLVICAATGKKIFLSPRAADRRRKELKRARNDLRQIYRCRHCRKWHLGHGNP